MARITNEEAIKLSQQILEETEQERIKYAEEEAKVGIQYDT